MQEESGSRSLLVSARGTSDGLVVRVDSRAEQIEVLAALREFVESRESFLRDQKVSLEWVGPQPDELFQRKVRMLLEEDFGIQAELGVNAKGLSMPLGSSADADLDMLDSMLGEDGGTLSLFDGIEGLDAPAGSSERTAPVDPALWDDPDARIIYSTLRSGQKVETEHSLVVCGDVNSGAEVVAGGDIIVLGTLRGVAHAGAYDESGGGRFIFALELRSTQLRVGSTISCGAGEPSVVGEIARIEGNTIIIEPYRSRVSLAQARSRR